MGGGKGNIRGKDNPKPFNTPEGNKNINRKGRPLSLTKDLKALLTKEENIFAWHKIKSLKTRIDDNGEMEVAIPLTRPEAIINRVMNHALGGSKSSMDAIKFIWEQIDGKAKQTIDMNVSEANEYDFSRLNDKEQITFMKLLEKVTVIQ